MDATRSIGERVKAAIAKTLCIDAKSIDPNALLFEDLGADALERIEIIVALEEDFNIDINDDAIETFATPGDIIRFLEARR
jgi:acyl carrier protein